MDVKLCLHTTGWIAYKHWHALLNTTPQHTGTNHGGSLLPPPLSLSLLPPLREKKIHLTSYLSILWEYSRERELLPRISHKNGAANHPNGVQKFPCLGEGVSQSLLVCVVGASVKRKLGVQHLLLSDEDAWVHRNRAKGQRLNPSTLSTPIPTESNIVCTTGYLFFFSTLILRSYLVWVVVYFCCSILSFLLSQVQLIFVPNENFVQKANAAVGISKGKTKNHADK